MAVDGRFQNPAQGRPDPVTRLLDQVPSVANAISTAKLPNGLLRSKIPQGAETAALMQPQTRH